MVFQLFDGVLENDMNWPIELRANILAENNEGNTSTRLTDILKRTF